MLINCTECNIEINKSQWDVNRSKHLFCSIDCKKTFYKKISLEKRICPNCQETFETKKHNPKIFCNHACSTTYNNKNKIKEKECLICFIKFKKIKTGKIIDNYCSDFCYENRDIKKDIKKDIIPTKISVQLWRKRTKEKIVILMGGKCQICGYNRSFQALDLHHLNPSEKEFSVANSLKNCIKWEIIEKEIKKCVLLCGNCHREVHAGLVNIENKTYFNKNLIKENKKENKLCIVCKKETINKQTFCSPECCYKSKRKVDWENLDLEELLKQFKNPEQIGKHFGISGAVVRKQIKKRGI